MIARGAVMNPSIFRPEPLPLEDVMRSYVQKSLLCGNIYQNTKYTLTSIMGEHKDAATGPTMKAVQLAKDMQSLARIWDLEQDYQRLYVPWIPDLPAKRKGADAHKTAKRLKPTEEVDLV